MLSSSDKALLKGCTCTCKHHISWNDDDIDKLTTMLKQDVHMEDEEAVPSKPSKGMLHLHLRLVMPSVSQFDIVHSLCCTIICVVVTMFE